MSEVSTAHIAEWNGVIRDCETYVFLTRDQALQEIACNRLDVLVTTIRDQKKCAISAANENAANLLLGFECAAQCVRAELTMWMLLKKGEYDEAWNQLILAQQCAIDSMRAHPGFQHLEEHNRRLESLEKLVFPPQVFVSAGWLVGRQECSICGAVYGECDHLAGKPYMGQFCAIIARDLIADHAAIVEYPADKRCRVTRFSAPGGMRSRMTWQVEPSDPVDHSDENKIVSDNGMRCEVILSSSYW
jgi:hypothetical protein